MIVEDAVKVLALALKENPDYYYSWQANIAMQMVDAYRWADHRRIKEIANNGAKAFLDLLVR